MADLRIGYGFDVHRMVRGRKLILGGVEIEFPKGLDGYSDADVVCHAIVDALLGASRLGDMGDNFPPTDPKYKDIAGLRLLELVKIKLANSGYEVENIDVTIICEEPRLDEIKEVMASVIAQTLRVGAEQVSIKATTSDGLGCTGEGKGIATAAVTLISEVLVEEQEEEVDEGYEDE